jgi:agmatine/peptidylarginine deiminase
MQSLGLVEAVQEWLPLSRLLALLCNPEEWQQTVGRCEEFVCSIRAMVARATKVGVVVKEELSFILNFIASP